MKRYTAIIIALLSVGCATTRTADYTWDVSVTPIGAHEYEFRGTLKRCASQQTRTMSGFERKRQEDILSIPTLKVTLDKPAEAVVGMPGEEPSVKATVAVQETPQKVVVTYSAMIREGTTQHAVQGRIEINR